MTSTTAQRVVTTRAELIEILRRNAGAIRALGATELYLFGSAARDELRADSDVDLYMDYALENVPSLFDLCGLQRHLAEMIGRDVDLMTRYGLHPILRAEIEQSAIRVF